MLVTKDSYEYLKTLNDHSNDIIYADPPYALGSEVIIRKDGKVDYAKANDFMNKWDMPTGEYWEKWFAEAYRTLKHGGYLIMFGMDRQLLLFKYYACLSGFVEQQSLYWYFISNFPKATDLSKMLESKLTLGTANTTEFKKLNGDLVNKRDTNGLGFAKKANELEVRPNDYNETSPQKLTNFKPTTDLAKKYDGHKYSISPLKQTNETIMVFKKPSKTGSVLHDTLAYENGDETISVGALNIDGNRVGTEKVKTMGGDKFPNNYGTFNTCEESINDGRYPSQTYCDSKVAEMLDRQSGISKSSNNRINKIGTPTDSPTSFGVANKEHEYSDIGGCSKILHKCDYTQEDIDLYYYEPKVSSSERNAGCDEFDTSQCVGGGGGIGDYLDDVNSASGKYGSEKAPSKNTHPTLKPIELNYRILKLFKTPNDQVICYPFAGAGSEIIGGIKAGFENWHGCELNQEYVDIANARIKYWQETMTVQTSIFDFL